MSWSEAALAGVRQSEEHHCLLCGAPHADTPHHVLHCPATERTRQSLVWSGDASRSGIRSLSSGFGALLISNGLTAAKPRPPPLVSSVVSSIPMGFRAPSMGTAPLASELMGSALLPPMALSQSSSPLAPPPLEPLPRLAPLANLGV